jgi:hypothetical protein
MTASPATTRTVTLSYSAVRALPQYPGDPDPRTYYRQIFAHGCEPYEAARELERAGYSVLHPARRPNGSGGCGAKVLLATRGQTLPRFITL